jgi:hypothetical protein
MNELLEGTNIEKAIHLVKVCKVTAYKACKLYGVKSDTLGVIASTQARKTKPDKRKRIVDNVGQCLTNQEAIDIMEEQERIKRKKLSDKVFDKKMMEENKLKQKQETENNRKLRLVKKQNAQRKECLCGKKQANNRSNKDYWMNCDKCGTWCCPDC